MLSSPGMSKIRLCALLLITFAFTTIAAAKKQGEAASIKSTTVEGAVKAGATVAAKITVALEREYHVHSHTPSEKTFIPTVLSLTPPKGTVIGKIKYPAGKSQKVQGLPKPLSVYEEEFQLDVPITLPAGLTLPLKIPATLSYQACQGAVCYPPRKLTFDILIIDAKK